MIPIHKELHSKQYTYMLIPFCKIEGGTFPLSLLPVKNLEKEKEKSRS